MTASKLQSLIYISLLVSGIQCAPKSHVCNYGKNHCTKEQNTLDITCGDSYRTFMRQLEDRAMNTEDMVDPTRCLYDKYNDIDEVDFLVIGAGIGGSVVAGRLSEAKNWEVMVLEAGGAAPAGTQFCSMYFNYLHDTILDWNYELLPQDNVCLNSNGICLFPRGKVMGGTGILHGMMYMRGNPDDYNRLAADGIEGWSYNDVLPYFLKSENNLDINSSWIQKQYHSTGGPLTISQFNNHPAFAEDLLNGWKELGFNINVDLNGDSQHGFMLAQATTVNGTRETTAKAYLYPHLKERKNLKILPRARVLKILIDESKTAVGVIMERDGIERVIKVRKEIILSAGTIASPQLLMLSGIGPKEHLQTIGLTVIKDLPGVGQNLNNHASTEIVCRIGDDSYAQELNVDSENDFFINRKGPMSSTGLSQVTGFMWTNPNSSDVRPDIQVFHAGFNANCSRTGLLNEEAEPGHRQFSISPTLLNALSVGYVKLRNIFPTSTPIIYGGVLTNESDVTRLLAGVRATLKLVNTTAMQNKGVYLEPTPMQGCEDKVYNSDDYWLCYIAHKTNPENHQTGTCRMGPSDNDMAVTDSELRVIGIKNLRVADASVFPRTPSGNLQAPVTMVGERAATFINNTWRTTDTKYY